MSMGRHYYLWNAASSCTRKKSCIFGSAISKASDRNRRLWERGWTLTEEEIRSIVNDKMEPKSRCVSGADQPIQIGQS